MSDKPPRIYCPGCETEADEVREFLVIGYCGSHSPSHDGLDDAGMVRADTVASEAMINRAFCALIHRDRVEPA